MLGVNVRASKRCGDFLPWGLLGSGSTRVLGSGKDLPPRWCFLETGLSTCKSG